MRIWNADGGEVGAAAMPRCVAALLVAGRGSPHVSIETEGGMAATVANDGSVTIDMAPRASSGTRSRSASLSLTRERSAARSSPA